MTAKYASEKQGRQPNVPNWQQQQIVTLDGMPDSLCRASLNPGSQVPEQASYRSHEPTMTSLKPAEDQDGIPHHRAAKGFQQEHRPAHACPDDGPPSLPQPSRPKGFGHLAGFHHGRV